MAEIEVKDSAIVQRLKEKQKAKLQADAATYENAVGQNRSRIISATDREASPLPLSTRLKTGLMTDQNAKFEALAKERFGDKSQAKRYGLLDGDTYFLDPKTGLDYKEPLPWYEGMAAEIPSIAGGAIGGARFGLPGAFVGAMSGEAQRRLLANAMGDKQTSMGNVKGMLGKGVEEVIGYGVGRGLGKLKEGRNAQDLNFYNRDATELLSRDAKELDIPLTTAQKTNLSSQKAQEHIIRNIPQSSNRMQAFDETQSADINNAVSRWLDSVSTTDDAMLSSTKIGKAAKGVVKDVEGVLSLIHI